MIRELRARHRWMAPAAGLVALGGLATALAVRPSPATMPALPAALLPEAPPADGPALLEGDALWQGASVRTAVFPAQVALSVLDPLRRPDPLLYWAERAPARGEPLPGDAVFLGAVRDAADQRFTLPRSGGALVLFSLGHGEVFATLSLEGAP